MSEHGHDPHTQDELRDALREHDDWFRHDASEPSHQQSHGDFNPYVVMGFLAATIVLVAAVVIVTVPWFGRAVQAKRVEVQEENRRLTLDYEQRASRWTEELTGSPSWVDEANNVIRVPIDLAIDEVVESYARGDR